MRSITGATLGPRQLMTCSPRLVGLVLPFVQHDGESPAPCAAQTQQDLGEAVSASPRPCSTLPKSNRVERKNPDRQTRRHDVQIGRVAMRTGSRALRGRRISFPRPDMVMFHVKHMPGSDLVSKSSTLEQFRSVDTSAHLRRFPFRS